MQGQRRHDDGAAGDQLLRHRFEARERHPLPFQLERRPAAEEVVVRGEEAGGIVRGGFGNAAQVFDARDARVGGLHGRCPAEMRGHRHAAGAGLGGNHGDQRRLQAGVDLDDSRAGVDLRADRCASLADGAHLHGVLPEALRPVDERP